MARAAGVSIGAPAATKSFCISTTIIAVLAGLISLICILRRPPRLFIAGFPVRHPATVPGGAPKDMQARLILPLEGRDYLPRVCPDAVPLRQSCARRGASRIAAKRRSGRA